MIVSIVLFVIGLILLIKGGDWFVDGATGIAGRFHIPELLIGATVVSIGTTLPEVMVSATAAVGGHGEMAYGNAIGSIICNTALVAAITVAVKPSKTDRSALKLPVVFFFIAAVIYVGVAYALGEFSLPVGILLLSVFAVYMTFLVVQTLKEIKNKKNDVEGVLDILDDEVAQESQSSKGDYVGFLLVGTGLAVAQIIQVCQTWGSGGFSESFFAGIGYWLPGILGAAFLLIGFAKAIKKSGLGFLNSNVLFLILGAAIIAIGADLLVDNGTVIAKWLGVPEAVIALTFIAIGTSLPELVTALTALSKGHGALSLGNVIGANLFNLVLVSGVASVLSPFSVPDDKLVFGINSSLVIDLPVMLFAMAFLTVPAVIKGRLSRYQGITLMCVYAVFCVLQFVI